MSRLASLMGGKPLAFIMGERKFPQMKWRCHYEGGIEAGQLYSALKLLPTQVSHS